jgi:hypothetical protein
MNGRRSFVSFAFLLAALPVVLIQGQEESKLVASDGAHGDGFGATVSIFGDRALVGAPDKDDAGPGSGAAYVFARDASGAWIQEAKLLPADAGPEQQFGYALALFGSRALIGAPGTDEAGFGSGAAYLFKRDSTGAWQQIARLAASDAGALDEFGAAVSLFGDRALIGAFADEDLGPVSGSAYVFECSAAGTWSQTAKLHASDGDANDGFGVSASLFGDRAVLGASGDEENGDDAGSAYVIERDATGAWIEVAKLLASDGAVDDVFGATVALCGDRVVVGAYGDDDRGDGAGAAYVFERAPDGSWPETTKLLGRGETAADLFGAVSICGERVVVGSRKAEVLGVPTGSAHVFERSAAGTWVEVGVLCASDGAADDHFGSATSIVGDRALVGARLEDHAAWGDQGAAYAYALGPGAAYCSPTANSTGAPAMLSATGSASLSANDLALAALPVPPGGGIFFLGSAPSRHSFGNGVLCVSGSLVRLRAVPVLSHVLAMRLDLGAPPLAGKVLAGSTWDIQAVFRDPAGGGARFNTSSAIEVLFLP